MLTPIITGAVVLGVVLTTAVVLKAVNKRVVSKPLTKRKNVRLEKKVNKALFGKEKVNPKVLNKSIMKLRKNRMKMAKYKMIAVGSERFRLKSGEKLSKKERKAMVRSIKKENKLSKKRSFEFGLVKSNAVGREEFVQSMTKNIGGQNIKMEFYNNSIFTPSSQLTKNYQSYLKSAIKNNDRYFDYPSTLIISENGDQLSKMSSSYLTVFKSSTKDILAQLYLNLDEGNPENRAFDVEVFENYKLEPKNYSLMFDDCNDVINFAKKLNINEEELMSAVNEFGDKYAQEKNIINSLELEKSF